MGARSGRLLAVLFAVVAFLPVLLPATAGLAAPGPHVSVGGASIGDLVNSAMPAAAVARPSPSGGDPGETLGLVGEVAVGDVPTAAIVDPVNGYVYVLDSGGNHVHILSNQSVLARVGAGVYPGSGVFDPADGDVYAVDSDSYNVTIYRGTTVVGNLSTGTFPYAAAYDPADSEVYVTDYGADDVSILNGTTSAESVVVAGGVNHPLLTAYDAADHDVYVVNVGGQCSVVVLHGPTIVANLSLPGTTIPSAIAYDPSDGDLYVADTGVGNLTVLNGSSVVGNVSVGGDPTALVYDPAVGAMLVLNDAANDSLSNQTGSGTVEVVNGTAETGTYAVPFEPTGGAYDPAAGAAVLFGNYSVPDVLVVNDTGLIETIPVPAGVTQVAYDPENQLAYLPNLETDNVTILGEGRFYAATFSETGLPTGTEWSVVVNGVGVSSSTSAVSIPLENGTYNYSISPQVRTPPLGNGSGPFVGNVTIHGLPPSGQLTVDGAPLSEPTARLQLAITVIFAETGLPNGTSWSVTFNGSAQSTSGTFLAFLVPNGTYGYGIGGVAGFRETSIATTGSLTLLWSDGPSDYLLLPFSEVTYQVQLAEVGLPIGAQFAATVAGEPVSARVGVGGAELTWSGLANGTYPYSLTAVPGWCQKTIAGSASVVVAGGTQPTDGTGVGFAATLRYAPVVYNVTFSTLGLPPTLTWKLTLDGTAYIQTAGALTVALPNGTYNYSLADISGWHQSSLPYAGRVTVDGANVAEESFYFVQVTYRITFAERGLPTGTNWSVVAGRQLVNSTGPTISFQIANTTTLTYLVGYVPGYSPLLSSGSFPVNGSALTVVVTFSANGHSGVPTWLVPGAVGAVAGGLVGIAIGFAVRPRRPGPSPLTPSEASPPPGASPPAGGT